jgi:hypothetical protein
MADDTRSFEKTDSGQGQVDTLTAPGNFSGRRRHISITIEFSCAG